jgi:hypothetical protein
MMRLGSIAYRLVQLHAIPTLGRFTDLEQSHGSQWAPLPPLRNNNVLLINWIQNKGQWTRLTDAMKPLQFAGTREAGFQMLPTTICSLQHIPYYRLPTSVMLRSALTYS